MKKISILLMILSLALLCACGGEEANNAPATPEPAPVETPEDDGIPTEPVQQPEEENTMIPNPVKEVTAQELGELTGVFLTAPEGVEAAFGVIESEHNIAQMRFVRDGVEVTVRVCSAGIPEGEPEDISGLYYEWKNTAEDVAVGYNSAYIHWNEGETGYITWYDFAPGLLYAVSVDSGATADSLTQLAVELYAPVQGEVG